MTREEFHDYSDIIDLPHHVSERHPQMAPLDRAAQFSPFAPLVKHFDTDDTDNAGEEKSD